MSRSEGAARAALLRYVLNPLVDLRWRLFGTEAVVFEVQSGDTIDLGALDAAIVMCFDSTPRSIDDVVSTLAADMDLPDTSVLGPPVTDLVEQLLAKGWILQSLDGP